MELEGIAQGGAPHAAAAAAAFRSSARAAVAYGRGGKFCEAAALAGPRSRAGGGRKACWRGMMEKKGFSRGEVVLEMRGRRDGDGVVFFFCLFEGGWALALAGTS